MQKKMPVIRKIEEQDIEAVAALERAAFSGPWSAKELAITAGQKHAYILVAMQDDKFAGYCIVYHVLDEAEIARIAVEPSFRRQGVGRHLLDAVMEECRAQDISRLLLDVRESNHGARTFYSRNGFREDGMRKNFYDLPKEDAVLMSMEAVSTRNVNVSDL